MKVIISIPENDKRIIDASVIEGKPYFIPLGVTHRLQLAVKLGQIVEGTEDWKHESIT